MRRLKNSLENMDNFMYTLANTHDTGCTLPSVQLRLCFRLWIPVATALLAVLSMCNVSSAATAITGQQPASANAAVSTAGTHVAPAAVGGAADTVGGYAAQVLEQTLSQWQPPAGISGMARVLVRVGSDGRVLSCEATPEPGANAKQAPTTAVPGSSFTVTSLGGGVASAAPSPLVDSVCLAVGKAGAFGVPPYAMLTEVYLSLMAGNVALAAQSRPADYADEVLGRVRPHVTPPVRLKGAFTTRIQLKVRADGSIEQIRVDAPSGNAAVDAAVLQAFAVPGVIPVPGTPKELLLSFTVSGE